MACGSVSESRVIRLIQWENESSGDSVGGGQLRPSIKTKVVGNTLKHFVNKNQQRTVVFLSTLKFDTVIHVLLNIAWTKNNKCWQSIFSCQQLRPYFKVLPLFLILNNRSGWMKVNLMAFLLWFSRPKTCRRWWSWRRTWTADQPRWCKRSVRQLRVLKASVCPVGLRLHLSYTSSLCSLYRSLAPPTLPTSALTPPTAANSSSAAASSQSSSCCSSAHAQKRWRRRWRDRRVFIQSAAARPSVPIRAADAMGRRLKSELVSYP